MRTRPFLTLLLAAAVLPAQASPPAADGITAPAPATPAAVVEATIVARFPHDRDAFTQGLIVDGDTLYENTGRYGQSELRRVELKSGKVLARAPIPADQFGEGLARWGDTLIGLTWKEGVAHRWTIAGFKPRGSFKYPGEGWGLTASHDALILSDGSPTLRFLDPRLFTSRRTVAVTLNGNPLPRLNELEYVDGTILANIWGSGFLVAIDPSSGQVTRVVDLRPLVAEVAASDPDAVLNGIAWDPKARRLFVTGKLWPTLFEIRIAGITDR